MSVQVVETPTEVVVRTALKTVYVCDGCGERWEIGHVNRPEAVNSLHPPRSWWRLAPADQSTLWEDGRETRHACSVRCLRKIAGGLTERP